MFALDEAFRFAIEQHRAGDIARAAETYEGILRKEPEHAGAWHLLGVVLHQRGDLEKALAHIERALSYCDTEAVYWNNYGVVLKDLGRLLEAKDAFRKALGIHSDYPDAWSNLGLVHLESADLQEAERCLRYALRLQPRHGDALRHLARVYRDKGDLEEAIRLCRDAIAVAPGNADSYSLLGELHIATMRFEEAADTYSKLVALNPNSAESHLCLGLVYTDMDEVERAREAFQRSASLRPDRPIWQLRELTLCPVVFPTAQAVVEYRARLEHRLEEALADPPVFDWRPCLRDGFVPSFQVCHHGVCNRALKEKFAALFAPSFPKGRPARENRSKIRVGFLNTSGHEGGFVRGFGRVMERLDRSQFEAVGLVSAPIVPFCKASVRAGDMQWVGFPHDIQRAWQAILAAKCDVILHWHAGTDTLNYFLPFLPLAPVQCIGFRTHGTTGISNIDYSISSRLFERGEDAAEDYTERLVQFPGATSPQPRPVLPAPATRAEFGLPASGAVYFCPERLAKFHPDFDRPLREVLEGDPWGHIVVLEGQRRRSVEALQARFSQSLGDRLTRRVLFLPAQKAQDYYRLLGLADAVLDTPVYSASCTGYDAFALGVPIVTLPGKYMVQRYALGLYTQMGIKDLIAADESRYVELALRLGREKDFREAMKRTILERNHVLYEDDSVIRQYEVFFREAVAGAT